MFVVIATGSDQNRPDDTGETDIDDVTVPVADQNAQMDNNLTVVTDLDKADERIRTNVIKVDANFRLYFTFDFMFVCLCPF